MTIDINGLIATAQTLVDELVGLPSITHAAYSSQDAWGAPTYATGVSRKASIVHKNRKVINTQGVEVISGTQVMIMDAVTVNVLDKITLPGGTTPPIISAESVLDSSGTPFAVEVFL